MRHNNPQNMIARHMSIVYHDVELEPILQKVPDLVVPLLPKGANLDDEARSDIRVRGFWSRQQSTFFYIRVF
jgi:hypothetical protein